METVSLTRVLAGNVEETGPFGRQMVQKVETQTKKDLSTPVVARELVVFSSAGEVKGEADNSFCSGGDLVRRPPNLARRCPFPAVTHPTRRGLPNSTGSTLDGMSLL